MKQQYIETGKVVSTHGIRGEVRFMPWSDCPEDILKYKTFYLDSNGKEKVTVSASRVHKNLVLIKLKNVDSIEDAEKLRNRVFYISRKDIKLKKGDYLICDLIGCRVFNSADNQILGELCDVSQTGANDVWHIKKDGKEYLVPAIPDVVDSVDVESEEVYITPLKGIFDIEEKDIIREGGKGNNG